MELVIEGRVGVVVELVVEGGVGTVVEVKEAGRVGFVEMSETGVEVVIGGFEKIEKKV